MLETKPTDSNPLLKVEGIVMTFGTIMAVNNVSFALQKGEVLGLIGENGSGKSTITSVIAGIPWLCWVGGLTSATSLGLNLYSLNFNLPTIIKNHTDAANELWDVREAYKTILIDYDEMTNEEIRSKRDKLTQAVSQINKKYPGTDDKAFATAKKRIQHYAFDEGESIKLLNVGVESKETNN